MQLEINQLKTKLIKLNPASLNENDDLSIHDFLTGLPNRKAVETRVGKLIDFPTRENQLLAVLYLDLDNFRIVNDSLGYDIGDCLLIDLANLLLNIIQEGDVVGRLGGDEFIIVLNSSNHSDYPANISQKIIRKLDTPFNINGKDIYANLSIGIAVYPTCGAGAVELIRNADMAMQEAKNNGKNQYRFFNEELCHQSEINLLIMNGLRANIITEEMFFVFQPIIDIKHQKCIGVEALLRWQHSQLGLIYPEQFLPIAERSGSMVALGHVIFKRALQDYCRMQLHNHLFLSFNMSAGEFASMDEEAFIQLIYKEKMSPKQLIIELTESMMIVDPQSIYEKMKFLTNAGVRIAVDDYGMGYSSLSLLKQLPLEVLKIDKLFIKDIGKDQNNTIIVKSTIQLAHNLGLKVVAEGIETKEQLDFLAEHGCDHGQGYYFSKPLDCEQLIEYIHQL